MKSVVKCFHYSKNYKRITCYSLFLSKHFIKNPNQSINQRHGGFSLQILYSLFFINQSETMAIWFEPIRSVNIIFGSINSLTPVQQYFSIIVVVSFIGGGNRSTWKKSYPTASH
jgi:hypothetical protein